MKHYHNTCSDLSLDVYVHGYLELFQGLETCQLKHCSFYPSQPWISMVWEAIIFISNLVDVTIFALLLFLHTYCFCEKYPIIPFYLFLIITCFCIFIWFVVLWWFKIEVTIAMCMQMLCTYFCWVSSWWTAVYENLFDKVIFTFEWFIQHLIEL